jgi:predicted AAA+ superfamily ATPase
MINRLITDELLSLISFFPAVGLVGPRQVGKTTLSKLLAEKLQREIIYLDLELPSDLAKLDEPELFLNQFKERFIVIDEVQRKPDLFPVLRALIDQHRVAGRFLLLGSASPELIRDSSESLAGRISYKELTPLNLCEIGNLSQGGKHWFRGGFPNALLAPSDTLSKNWLSSFVQSYVERDLPLLGLQVSPVLIRRFWSMLAHLQAGLWNASTVANSLGVTAPTVKRYFDFMEQAYMVRRLPAFHTNAKKRLVRSPKVYIRDSGILHHLVGIKDSEQLQGHPILGASWEGYVIEQISQVIGSEIELFYYRTHEGTECDLVLTRGGKSLACIEIKYTSSPKVSKGFRIAIEDLASRNNFIVTPASADYLADTHIRVCNLKDFLTKYIPAIKT